MYVNDLFMIVLPKIFIYMKTSIGAYTNRQKTGKHFIFYFVTGKFVMVSLMMCIHSLMTAQTVVVPQTVTASVNPFNSNSTKVTNLNLNITTATTSATTFPYSPSSNFSTGIGFVSQLGVSTGTITYTFANPVSISQMMIWNGYFTFELNHCAKDVQLVFRDASNVILNTTNLQLPQATSGNLAPHVANLSSEVLGVKQVDIVVNSLWGGNEISIRRIAFAGTGQTVGIEESNNQITIIPAYPNPAVDQLTIPGHKIQSVQMVDAAGRPVAVEITYFADRAELQWQGVASGVYLVQVSSAEGQYSTRVFVASN